MNKPPSDYNAIKSLVENNENNIEFHIKKC
jgi:hypothetical protein